jgi:hypothetical protein
MLDSVALVDELDGKHGVGGVQRNCLFDAGCDVSSLYPERMAFPCQSW